MISNRSPFFAADPAWWEITLGQLREATSGRLPIETILLDLRHLENECRRGQALPALAELRQRWGCSRNYATKVLSGALGDWHDPRAPLTIEDMRAVGRPTNRQGATGPQVPQKVPQKVPPETEEAEVSAKSGTPKSTPPGTPGAPKPAEEGVSGSPQPDQPDQPLRDLDPTDQDPCGLPATGAIRLSAVRRAREETAADRDRRLAEAIYSHWREGYHQDAEEVADADDLKRIAARLRQTATRLRKRTQPPANPSEAAAELLKLTCDWIHRAPSAAFFQGHNRRGPGGKPKKYLGIGTLYKRDKWSDRLTDAMVWDRDGRPQQEAPPTAEAAGHRQEGVKAWDYLLRLIGESHTLPDQLHPHADKARSFRAAIDAIGIANLRRAAPPQLPGLRASFLDAYCEDRAAKRPQLRVIRGQA